MLCASRRLVSAGPGAEMARRWEGLLFAGLLALGLRNESNTVDAFYLPGGAPRNFMKGDKVCFLSSAKDVW